MKYSYGFPVTFVCFICFVLTMIIVVAGNNNDIAILTDANFEHDTQATTGSTTGRWLILFHNANNKAEVESMLKNPQTIGGGIKENEEGAEEAEEEEEEEKVGTSILEDLLEQGVVVGMLDIKENPITVERFNIPGTPHAILLDKGKLYRTNGWDEIKDFALSEYEILSFEEVPALPSPADGILSHPYANFIIGGIFMVVAMGLVVTMFSNSKTNTTKKTK